MTQLGNQVAYINEAPGGRLFIRINFKSKNNRTVPTIQLSRDGLKWTPAHQGPGLAGSFTPELPNVYFLGFSTIDGTGKIRGLEEGKFHLIYGATVSKSPTAPHNFSS